MPGSRPACAAGAASAPYIEGPTFTVDGYADDPASFTGVLLNTSYHPFETIIHSS